MRGLFKSLCVAGMMLLFGTAQAADQPNIIFVLADDLGYGDLSCYGQETLHTPNLDQMAAEGMRFVRHYAGSTVCAPLPMCPVNRKAHRARFRARQSGRSHSR